MRGDTLNYPLCGAGNGCPITPICNYSVNFTLSQDIAPHTWE